VIRRHDHSSDEGGGEGGGGGGVAADRHTGKNSQKCFLSFVFVLFYFSFFTFCSNFFSCPILFLRSVTFTYVHI